MLPVAAQFTWFKQASSKDKVPPVIISGQVGYTPFLNAPHDYQILEDADVIFPTELKALTVVLQQSDTYRSKHPLSASCGESQ
jgi:hypothetical protein